MSPEDKDWLKEWLPKVGVVAYLLCILAFIGSHVRPGSPDSLLFALKMGVAPALLGTLIVIALMYLWRRRS
ncbi:hypothetical protein [Algihabitans albus]|uniref:hypothetical protein n=1 Tax=Algihabitans albus TaxID=2164067 RepID=UPI000E5C8DE4|nr:hypothetical protein [Algihabitans albus]